MIVRNSDNVILYGADWSLNETCAFNDELKKRDSTTNIANATYYDIKTPIGFVGGYYSLISGEVKLNNFGVKASFDNFVNQLKEIRVSRAFGGYSYKSQFFGKDDNDCNNISKTGFAIAGGIFALGASTGGYWKNTSGERVLFVNDDFVGMATGLAMFQLKNRQGYHGAKDALATAETEQEINAIIEAYRNFDPSV